MSNYEHNGEDDTLAARRTAHALGQTSGDERAEVEREMAASPHARQEVEAIAALAKNLKEAAETTPPAARSPELRAAVEARLTELESAARPVPLNGDALPWWRRRVTAWAVSAACLAAVAVMVVESTKFAGQGVRSEVAKFKVAPSSPATKALNESANIIVSGARKTGDATVELPTFDLSKVESSPSAELEVDPTLPAPRVRPLEYQFSRVLEQSGGNSASGIAIAGGLASSSTVTETWRPRSNSEPQSGRGHAPLYSDVVNLNDVASSNYSLQSTYDPNQLNGIPGGTYGNLMSTQGAGVGGQGLSGTAQIALMGSGSLTVSDTAYTLPPTNVTGVVSGYVLAGPMTVSGGTLAVGALAPSSVMFANSTGSFALNSNSSNSTQTAGGPLNGAPSDLQLAEREHNARYQESTAEQRAFLQRQSAVAANNAPGFNFNDTQNPLGNNGLGTNLKPAAETPHVISVIPVKDGDKPSEHSPNGQVALGTTPAEPPIVYPDAGWWKDMSKRRREMRVADNNSASGKAGGEWIVNPVQIETLPGLDVMVIKGNPSDVALVQDFVKQVEGQKLRDGEGENKPAESLGRSTVSARLTKEDLERAEKSLNAAIRVKREEIRRGLESLSSVDDQTTLLRGPKAAKIAQESRQDLDELENVASVVRQQLRSSQLSAEEGKRISDKLASTSEQASQLRKEIASVEAKYGIIAPKKPLETWKPARVVPNASRLMVGEKEELPLKGMQVDVRVDGFRARVLLDLYYFNDRQQQLEGNFQLRLPDEAAPYFFAFGKTVYQAPQVTANDSMFFKPQQVSLGDTTPEKILALRGNSWEQPKVARMVPKEKAAMAYRDTVRRRIDPALVEWSGAGVFQCRVFPLAPQSLHRVTIGYDVDLVRVGDDLELRLDLPEWQSGDLAPATVVDLNVAAADARQVSLDSPATQTPDGRLAYRLVDPKQRPLTLRLRKPGTLMLTGNDETTGNYFATRVTLPLPENRQGAGSGELERGRKGEGEKGSAALVERSSKAIFLVDTSLSAGPQFPLWTKMLRATLDNNRDQIKQFAVLFFNVETFWWQEKYFDNTPENVDALMNYADSLALEGATDLGRALTEAAAPKWRKAEEGASPDLFLLSDGAATWGEDRWALLAANLTGPLSLRERARAREDGSRNDKETALTPGPSPEGRGENDAQPAKAGTPALFAYHTALAGGDSRLLGYLAERTGGAVFSLVGDAEIATASVAHRNRPWKLTNLEMAGAHDVLVAGRPQYVFPGQQLTIVGRSEERLQDWEKRRKGEAEKSITFTLQQGAATQTVKVAMDQVIPSELAGRTFGQVATNQLEDVAGVQESAESVATAYARHFRITGRTCSLLMLESEQDYARFNIKPEEDDFVVKQRPADPIVSKAITDAVAAMSDPKASFLAWYNRLAASEVRFDLPASLKVYIDSLPDETFAVVPNPLVCKLRLRNDLPQNLRQPWQTGLAEYDTLDAEAQRRLSAYGADDALRCLSSLVEERPGDAVVARALAFTAIDWQRPGEAYHLLRRASAARTFEPITFHAMAHCLEQMGRTDLAIIYYELACGGQWDQRFGDMHNIAMLDYARFLRRVSATKIVAADYAQSRLNTLEAMNLRDTADVAALIFWNTDGTDVDLHVVEPSGEECFYGHTQTASGGHISRDVTTGYGPELYLLPKAPSGRYDISAHYFASDMNRASTRTKVLAFIYENWGAKDERLVIKSLALTGQKEKHELGVVKR